MSIAERKAAVKAAFDAKNAEVERRQSAIAQHQAEIRRLQDEINTELPDLYRLQGQFTALEETEALASPQQPHLRKPRHARRGRR